MRKIIALALSLLCIASLAGCGGSNSGSNNGEWITIEANGFSYEVSEGWHSETMQGGNFTNTLYSPAGAYQRMASLQVFATHELLGNDGPVVELSYQEMVKEVERMLSKVTQDDMTIDYEDILIKTIGEYAMGTATQLVYQNGELLYKGLSAVIFTSPNSQVEIHFTCPPSEFDNYKPKMQHVIDSFKLI